MQITCPQCRERTNENVQRCPGCHSPVVDLALRLEAALPRDEWGRFHDVRLLNRIPGATVYLARDRRENRQVRIRAHDPQPRSAQEITALTDLYSRAWDWQLPRLSSLEWRISEKSAFVILETPPGPPLADWLSEQEFISFPTFATMARSAAIALRDLEAEGFLHGSLHTESFFHDPQQTGLVLDLPAVSRTTGNPASLKGERQDLAAFLYFLLTGCDPRFESGPRGEQILLWPADVINSDQESEFVPITAATHRHPSGETLKAIDQMLTPLFLGREDGTPGNLLRGIERLGLLPPETTAPAAGRSGDHPRIFTDETVPLPSPRRKRIHLRPVTDRRGKQQVMDPGEMFVRLFMSMTPPPIRDARGRLVFTSGRPYEPLLAAIQAALEAATLAMLVFGRNSPAFSQAFPLLLLLLLITVPLRFWLQRTPTPEVICDPQKRRFFSPSPQPGASEDLSGNFQDIAGTGVAGFLGFHEGQPGWYYRIEFLFMDGRRLTVSPLLPEAVWTLDETAAAIASQLGVPHLPARPERFLRVVSENGQFCFTHAGAFTSLLAGFLVLAVDGARRMLREDLLQWLLLLATTFALATLGIQSL